jgi:hypothetical protein
MQPTFGDLESATKSVTLLTDIDRLRLLEAIRQCFSLGELHTLCFELGVDYDDLPAKINRPRLRGWSIMMCLTPTSFSAGRR